MNNTPLTDAVAQQYAAFAYPTPIDDLTTTAPAPHDPALSWRKYWPRLKLASAGLEILIAGCGTNQAAQLAYHNRGHRVVGIDISETSLDHSRRLQERHNLANLELACLPIEAAANLGRSFDLIASHGVLHHLENPQSGMNALAGLLKPDGVITAMVYARYGYAAIAALQSCFRALGLRQDDYGLAVVKDALAQLPPGHPVSPYLQGDLEMKTDAGLVDAFLHARVTTWTVADCIGTVERAGLTFQGWFDNGPYYPEYLIADGPLLTAMRRLPEREMWQAMETFFIGNGNHTFIACRRDRPSRDYVIDFTSAEATRFIVGFTPGVRLTGDKLYRGDRFWILDEARIRLARGADGRSTIQDVLRGSNIVGDDAELERRTIEFFASLWRLGMLTVGLP